VANGPNIFQMLLVVKFCIMCAYLCQYYCTIFCTNGTTSTDGMATAVGCGCGSRLVLIFFRRYWDVI